MIHQKPAAYCLSAVGTPAEQATEGEAGVSSHGTTKGLTNSSKRLLLACLGGLILALSFYTGLLAHHAAQEGQLCTNAPFLPAEEQAIQGSFYRLKGRIEAGLINPARYPEVENAISWMVMRQIQITPGAPWQPDPSFSPESGATDLLLIDGTAVLVGSSAIVATPRSTVYRTLSATTRLAIEQRHGLDLELIACGEYRSGLLGGGYYQRLLLSEAHQLAPSLARIARASLMKAGIFGVFTVFLLAAGSFTIYLAARRHSR